MNLSSKQALLPARLSVVVTLARLLDLLDRSGKAVSPEQYRVVAGRLSQALQELAGEPALEAVLSAFPAAAELYENLNYQHAGLCRSPLEAALNAELRAHEVIAKAARHAPATPGEGAAKG
ncbi:hypothetical protein OOT46_15595 [Aquabacterium sp. A7-Y]|uniref:hypothetical protein n=1 Tax=Aquabacterium sp. A7-Y TaxID=1349605 RepID=UPI00223DCB1B|nr:hypothetical protein [Aquabacterium sp. A7-Y]MCW7539268.1 hypothetical protein [Aquabacterium sp. A7-Y]